MGQLASLETHLSRGEWLQAKREANRIWPFRESLSPKEQGRLYRGLARAVVGLGEDIYGVAKLLELALPKSLQGRDWDMLGTIRAELGTAYSLIGDWSASLEYFKAYHLDFERYADAKGLYGRVEYNAGVVSVRRREYEAAVCHYQQALSWSVERGLTLEAGEVHQNLAWVYCLLSRPQEALPHLECADTYRERLSPEYAAMQLVCRALYHYRIGEIRAAILGVEEILEEGRQGATPEHRGDAAWIGAQIALDVGHLDGARHFLNVVNDVMLDTEDWGLSAQVSALRKRLHELEQDQGDDQQAAR